MALAYGPAPVADRPPRTGMRPSIRLVDPVPVSVVGAAWLALVAMAPWRVNFPADRVGDHRAGVGHPGLHCGTGHQVPRRGAVSADVDVVLLRPGHAGPAHVGDLASGPGDVAGRRGDGGLAEVVQRRDLDADVGRDAGQGGLIRARGADGDGGCAGRRDVLAGPGDELILFQVCYYPVTSPGGPVVSAGLLRSHAGSAHIITPWRGAACMLSEPSGRVSAGPLGC